MLALDPSLYGYGQQDDPFAAYLMQGLPPSQTFSSYLVPNEHPGVPHSGSSGASGGMGNGLKAYQSLNGTPTGGYSMEHPGMSNADYMASTGGGGGGGSY